MRWCPRQGNRWQTRRKNGKAAQEGRQGAKTVHDQKMAFICQIGNHRGVTSWSSQIAFAVLSRTMRGEVETVRLEDERD
jgi:hypothetical protein